MSWDNTYTHTLALAIDRFFAAMIFNEPDITISSLCWVVLNAGNDPIAAKAIALLKLYAWQKWLLLRIGGFLEYFWKGHCANARLGDISTGNRAVSLLT
jgi:hypothetical protein